MKILSLCSSLHTYLAGITHTQQQVLVVAPIFQSIVGKQRWNCSKTLRWWEKSQLRRGTIYELPGRADTHHPQLKGNTRILLNNRSDQLAHWHIGILCGDRMPSVSKRNPRREKEPHVHMGELLNTARGHSRKVKDNLRSIKWNSVLFSSRILSDFRAQTEQKNTSPAAFLLNNIERWYELLTRTW